MLGVSVNAAAILLGSAIGILFNKNIPKKIADAVMTSLGLCIVYIGISGALKSENVLVMIISLCVGTVIGELADIHKRVEWIAQKLQERFAKNNEKASIAEGFITASLVFCFGAMSVVGSLQAGIEGNNEMLFTKATLDFVSSTIFGASLGFGVALSAAAVFIFQGTIVLTAQFIAPFLSDYTIAEMNGVGSILILAVGLNVIGITEIKVANFMPAIIIPVILCMFM